MVGLFFVGLVMHLSEEGRFPGGFVELITEHLHFTASSRHLGEIVTAAYVLVIAFVPLFFPRVPFLALATMMLGVLGAAADVPAPHSETHSASVLAGCPCRKSHPAGG
jgi:hypothetical protein